MKPIPEGFFIHSQLPIDAKLQVNTLAELKDLGTNNEKAFYYYKGIKIECLEDYTTYQWVEVSENNKEGLLNTNFQYPANYFHNNIDYSNKYYNFLAKVSGAGSSTNYTLNLTSNTLEFKKGGVVVNSIDLSFYLDDTNLSRITSGTLDTNTGILTVTRDDNSTFDIDLSSLREMQADFNETDPSSMAFIENKPIPQFYNVDISGSSPYALDGSNPGVNYYNITNPVNAISFSITNKIAGGIIVVRVNADTLGNPSTVTLNETGDYKKSNDDQWFDNLNMDIGIFIRDDLSVEWEFQKTEY